MKRKIEEDTAIEETKAQDWVPRKSAKFVILSEIIPEDRVVVDYDGSICVGDNTAKFQFKCQPKTKDTGHSSLESVSPDNPIKEIVYRILVNNKKPMKLGDIVEKTFEIVKMRKPPFRLVDDDIHKYFYRLLSEDTYYGFEEIQ